MYIKNNELFHLKLHNSILKCVQILVYILQEWFMCLLHNHQTNLKIYTTQYFILK